MLHKHDGGEMTTEGSVADVEVSPHVGRRISLFGSLMYFVPSYFLSIASFLGLNMVAARMLGTDDFGYFVVLVNATTLVGQFALVGVHRSGLREAASADSKEALGHLRRGVRAVLLIPLPFASVATAVLIIVWRGSSPANLATAMLSGILVFFAGYQKVSANFLRGLGHVRAASMLTGRSGGALIVLAQAVCVLIVAWLAPDSGLPGVLAAASAGFLMPLAWSWWMLRRSMPHGATTARTWEDLRHVVKRDWRFALSQAGGFLNSTVELWIAGAILTAGATSLYAASLRIGSLLLVPSTSLQVVFSPALARLAKNGDRLQLEGLIRTAASVATAVCGVLWLPMILIPATVLTIVFGDGFSSAAPALMFLTTGYLLNSISGLSATVLSMAHYEGDVALINWGGVIARIIFGSVCASIWGVTGLAASSMVIATVHYAVSWWVARQRLSISTHVTIRPKLALLGRIAG